MPLCSRSRREAGGRPQWQRAGLHRQGIGNNFVCIYEVVSNRICRKIGAFVAGPYE